MQNVKHPVFNIVNTNLTATVKNTIKQSVPYVQINDTKISVEIVETPAEVQKGLSGRTSLDASNGMLFIFSKADYYNFWMPDMYFPIDIIWINNNQIVDISHNVSNKFDPANPKFYLPIKKANYILEVNAGFSKKNNIKIGNTIFLNNVK
ncbi:MAG: DUF192 domain-containing protein [bacterium]|nr:DUF192 domain-containing protein [bacterium]